MQLNALDVSGRGQKILSFFTVFITALFFCSFFYSKQLYRITFYILVLTGFYIALKRSIGLLKNNFSYPWKYFLVLAGICVIWFIYLAISESESTGIADSGAIFALYFIFFLFLFFTEEKQEKILYLVFILVTVSALLSAEFNGMTLASFKDMGSKFSKYLLIASLIPLYRYIQIKNSQIILMIGVASILIGVMALINFWDIEIAKFWLFDEQNEWGGRAAGNSTPARFGTIGACLLCINFTYILLSDKHRLLLLVAIGSSLLAVLLSQSRGPWLAVIFFILLILCILPNYGKRSKISIFFILAILAALIFQISFVKDRIQLAIESYDTYMQAEDHTASEKRTAVGLRLELWRASYEMFLKSPIFGVGAGNYKYELKEIVNSGYYHPNTLKFHSAHNQFFAALSGRGLLGISATLLFFWICFFSFYKRISKSNNARIQSSLFAGIAVIVIYVVSGLTSETIDQKYLLMFYIVSISMFYSVSRFVVNTDNYSKKY